jgi:hypothetical protein
MQVMSFRFASTAAMAAAVAMASAPLAAAELPNLAPRVSVARPGVFDAAGKNAAEHRRRGHRDGVDAGDVIAGVAVVGVIAALANAVSKQSQRDARRTQGYPYPERPYDYRGPTDTRYDDSRGIDRAVDACMQELGRGGAVDTVDTVERTGNGWHVAGRLRGGTASAGRPSAGWGHSSLSGRAGRECRRWKLPSRSGAKSRQLAATCALFLPVRGEREVEADRCCPQREPCCPCQPPA